MLWFNKKAILPAKLSSPKFAFDPDYNKLKVIKTDYRDNSVLKYRLNNGNYETINGLTSYTLPMIDVEYDFECIAEASNSKYKSSSIVTSKIFSNDENCKYFKYSGDDYNSQDIYSYIGSSNNVIIPKKHNLVNTTSATITKFPNVIEDNIQITTPSYMTDFNIRDDRITEFTIKNGRINPIEYQFGNLPNLINIHGVLSNCSDYMFYNSPKLNMDPSNTKGMSQFGLKAFYNTNSQKSIRFSGNTLDAGVCDYDGVGVQKAIFTSANSINGLTNNDIPYGTFTNGMLYNTDKKHQIYCDVTDSVWRDGPATSNEVINKGYNCSTNNAPNKTFVLEPRDSNVFGLDIVVYDEDGNEINHTQNIQVPGEYSLTDTYVYGKDTTPTNNFDLKYKVDTTVSFYDRFHLTPIDRNGLMDTVVQSPYGEIAPAPRYRIRRLFKLLGANIGADQQFQLTHNGYTFNVSVPMNEVYEYIICDNRNTNICMARYVMRDANNAIDLGLNGKAVQHPEMTLIKNYGDYGIYRIKATDYYSYSTYTTGSEYNFPDMLFFYRDYRYGYINESPAQTAYDSSLGHPSGSTNRMPTELTNTNNEFTKWYDVWMENGSPTFKNQIAFHTIANGSTLTLNGSEFETNVPAGRLYCYYDRTNAPIVQFRIFDKGYNHYWTPEGWTTKSLNPTSDPNIWWFDISEYFNLDAISNYGQFSTIYDGVDDFYIDFSYVDVTGSYLSYPLIRMDTAKLSFTY